jgi:glycosyltransferase involved in cell wall biosynthesis
MSAPVPITARRFPAPAASGASRTSRAENLRFGPPPAAPVRRSSNPTVSVVIPTLNEAANVTAVIQGLPWSVTEVIVVDGRSTDDTVRTALDADPRVRVVLERRRGKGVAMLSGFASATADLIVAMDADGSMDPGEIEIFHATLARGYDLVKGSREAVGGGSEDFSLIRRLGNGALTRLANSLHGTRWSDMCYGYFGFWRDALPMLDLGWPSLTTRGLVDRIHEEVTASAPAADADTMAYGDGFEIEALLFLRAARAKLRIAEVPSRELPRNAGTSNLRTVRDGARVLSAIARERVRRPRVVSPEQKAPE